MVEERIYLFVVMKYKEAPALAGNWLCSRAGGAYYALTEGPNREFRFIS